MKEAVRQGRLRLTKWSSSGLKCWPGMFKSLSALRREYLFLHVLRTIRREVFSKYTHEDLGVIRYRKLPIYSK